MHFSNRLSNFNKIVSPSSKKTELEQNLTNMSFQFTFLNESSLYLINIILQYFHAIENKHQKGNYFEFLLVFMTYETQCHILLGLCISVLLELQNYNELTCQNSFIYSKTKFIPIVYLTTTFQVVFLLKKILKNNSIVHKDRLQSLYPYNCLTKYIQQFNDHFSHFLTLAS